MPKGLPNPRAVSNALGDISLSPNGEPVLSKSNWNLLFPIWAQFIDHDVSLIKSSAS